MVDEFLKLPREDQVTILNIHAPRVGKSPEVAEKDIWICWALQQLFSMPGAFPMAFKGGTALSKVYRIIERFSEDVDITLDHRRLTKENPESISKAALAKLTAELRSFVSRHSIGTVKPYFEDNLKEQFPGRTFRIEVSDDGEKLRIHYPSVCELSEEQYVAAHVLIEFGGRNITDPNEQHTISPYITNVPGVSFPEANVIVLALPRSFWEKATLIHVECNRKTPRASAERMSRHWYDLALMSQHNLGKQAMADRGLLADVVKHKKLFFNAAYANYDACLKSGFRLVPQGGHFDALRRDFDQMIRSGMFYGQPPVFADVIAQIEALEQVLNAAS